MRLPVKPNAVDRLVSVFSPRRGLERLKARAALHLVTGGGGYDAGRSDSPGLKSYNPSNGSGITDIHPGLGKIRERSRDLVRNDAIASGAVANLVGNAIGTGLRAKPNVDRIALGLTDAQADEWEALAERFWTLWAETPAECHISGRLTFDEQLALVVRSIGESGDILHIRRYLWDGERQRPKYGAKFATKVQLVEADRVSNPNNVADTSAIAGGVEIDENGRHVRFHVRDTHPGEMLHAAGDIWRPVPAFNPKNGRPVATLLFETIRVDQRRGVPWVAAIVEPLLQLKRWSQAELDAAVVSALFTVFVTGSIDPEGGGPLDNVIGGEEGYEPGKGEISMGQASVIDLGDGEDVKFADPKRPNAQFDPFWLANVRAIGIALQIPYEVLIQHFSSSYSASRAAMLEAWRTYRGWRKKAIRWLAQPCYEELIDECVIRGMLIAPGYFEDPLVRQAYLRVDWTGDAMPQLDPLKEVGAAKVRIEEGLSTREREARELNGTSWEANHRQRVREETARMESGLTSPALPDAAFIDNDARQLPETTEAA